MKATIILIILIAISLPFFDADTPQSFKYLGYFFLFSLYIYVHKKIIKRPGFEWYRWLVNSLIYRCHVYILKRKIRKLSYMEKIHYHSNRIIQRDDYPKWFDKYWFGRGLFNVIANEMIKAHNKSGIKI